MVKIEPIKNSTLNLVISLLQERNNTLAEYTKWKYYREDDNIDRGYLAYYNNECVGCFGLVPKQLYINGKNEICGWFADWYVSKEYRKYGIGEKLLQALSTNYKIVFGHPGPEKAQKLCSNNGYTPIPYQLRLRYVLSKWNYIKGKTAVLPKQLFYLLKLNKEERSNKLTHITVGDFIYFNEDGTYTQWITSQPTAEYSDAEYLHFKHNDATILYLVYSENAKRRGHIVTYKNITPSALSEFLNSIKKDGLEYIDVFTTNADEAKVLTSSKCIKINEAPIMVYGLDTLEGIKIEGIDRENWTFFAK